MPSCLKPYEPLNVLKPIAENVWVVDGPEIRMRYLFGSIPFTTRMTVIRLGDGSLWLHSPTPADEALVQAVRDLGPVRFLVAPNRLHYWWIGDWKARHPEALAYAAPRVRQAAGNRFSGFDVDLDDDPPAEWAGELAQAAFAGSFMTEIAFFHHPSRTLVLTDMIENFEPGRVGCWHLRALMRFGGVVDPHGGTPRDLRATFWGRRTAARAAAQEMVGWRPERVLLAHGRCYLTDAQAELERAFRWIL